MGNSRKYPYTTMDGFLEFRGQGECSLNWNSEGMGEYLHLEFWRLKNGRYQFVNEARPNDTTLMTAKVQDAGEASIDLTCWRKLIKLGLYIKFMNFLMMNIRSIKYEQIFVPICTVNIDAPIGITWTAKTRTSPLLLQLGTPARFCTVRVSQKYKKIPSKKLSKKTEKLEYSVDPGLLWQRAPF